MGLLVDIHLLNFSILSQQQINATCMPGSGPGSLMLRKLRTSWYVPGTPPSWA